MEEEEECIINIVKVKILCNLYSTSSKTYKFKMAIFRTDQPEELLFLSKNS